MIVHKNIQFHSVPSSRSFQHYAKRWRVIVQESKVELICTIIENFPGRSTQSLLDRQRGMYLAVATGKRVNRAWDRLHPRCWDNFHISHEPRDMLSLPITFVSASGTFHHAAWWFVRIDWRVTQEFGSRWRRRRNSSVSLLQLYAIVSAIELRRLSYLITLLFIRSRLCNGDEQIWCCWKDMGVLVHKCIAYSRCH